MPNRTIFNKYGFFVAKVRKIAKKKQLEEDDLQVVRRAGLVAALCSSQSWQTYKYLHDGGRLERELACDEVRKAFDESWKNITETDLEEVATSDIPEHLYSMWLFYAFGKDNRQQYKDLLHLLKDEFADGLEPVERVEE